MPETFRARLARGGPLLLDAAMGTELARRGADTSGPLWSARALVEAPALVETIHRENVEAGAEIVTIDTFRLHERNVRRAPREFCLEGNTERLGARQLIARAVNLARQAAEYSPSKKSQLWIAGSLAPLEDCYRPDLVPSEAEILREHREMAQALAGAGVDLILVETMNSIRELVAAVAAAVATGLPVVASMVTDGSGRLLSGEAIADAARALLALRAPPDVFGVNCVPARALSRDLALLAAAAPGIPLAAYGNTGRAVDETLGLFTDPIEPSAYAELAASWVASGARLVGGCCGTTAAHVTAIGVRLRSLRS